MSLSALNSPPLVGFLSVANYALVPVLQQTFQNQAVSWNTVKAVNLIAYGLSVLSVSQPGRYDGPNDDGENGTEASEGMEKMSTGKRGMTLLPPAGWAFAIWGPIYLGELFMTGTQFAMMDKSSPLSNVVREITGPYVAAQIFQALWTASFRPKYNSGLYKYVSVLNLSGTAYALSFCHKAFTTNASTKYNVWEYLLNFFPLTLHFGWVTAASLVNLNGMFAMGEEVSNKAIAQVGHISAVGASILGILISFKRSAPLYSGVIAWALAAVTSGLAERINETDTEDARRPGIHGAVTQRALCRAGALANIVASFIVCLKG